MKFMTEIWHPNSEYPVSCFCCFFLFIDLFTDNHLPYSWKEWWCLYLYSAWAWWWQVGLWESIRKMATSSHCGNNSYQCHLYAGWSKWWKSSQCRCSGMYCLHILPVLLLSERSECSMMFVCRKSGGKTMLNLKGKLQEMLGEVKRSVCRAVAWENI